MWNRRHGHGNSNFHPDDWLGVPFFGIYHLRKFVDYDFNPHNRFDNLRSHLGNSQRTLQLRQKVDRVHCRFPTQGLFPSRVVERDGVDRSIHITAHEHLRHLLLQCKRPWTWVERVYCRLLRRVGWPDENCTYHCHNSVWGDCIRLHGFPLAHERSAGPCRWDIEHSSIFVSISTNFSIGFMPFIFRYVDSHILVFFRKSVAVTPSFSSLDPPLSLARRHQKM